MNDCVDAGVEVKMFLKLPPDAGFLSHVSENEVTGYISFAPMVPIMSVQEVWPEIPG